MKHALPTIRVVRRVNNGCPGTHVEEEDLAVRRLIGDHWRGRGVLPVDVYPQGLASELRGASPVAPRNLLRIAARGGTIM